jgi:polygalacturonase
VRCIEANCGSACTITIPWAGNYQVSDVITIKDIGSAVTNNVTINTAGGGTINGVSSYVMSRNKEALVLRADSTGDWRIVSLYQPNSYGVRQAVNAADYGCDLADNGTNDTACLVAAIAAAQASGGKTLYLPTGTYNTDAITANVNGLIIEGVRAISQYYQGSWFQLQRH